LVSLATKDLCINEKKSKDVKGSGDSRRNDIKENESNEVPHERKNK
jgi:hypothetical protein